MSNTNIDFNGHMMTCSKCGQMSLWSGGYANFPFKCHNCLADELNFNQTSSNPFGYPFAFHVKLKDQMTELIKRAFTDRLKYNIILEADADIEDLYDLIKHNQVTDVEYDLESKTLIIQFNESFMYMVNGVMKISIEKLEE